ncbi:MAG: DUF1700 domain-containing protein [Clostridiales bacterium]|nr:DUF1700 domain-containing protein [Clostridiales bacterium]
MTKQEFLNELKVALSGKVTPEAMMDSYRYYDSYIDECVRKGQTEEEAVEALGKPALIARSIIAAQTGERSVDEEYTEDGKTRKVRRQEKGKKDGYYGKDSSDSHKEFHFDPGAWYAKLLYVLILVLFMVLVFCILKGVIWIFFTFGIPILIVLGIIYLIMYFTGKQ